MARAKSKKSGITIVDIARRLGLSAMTVSRALSGKGEVSEQTGTRVRECAQKLGYQPNRWARSLVTRRSSIIGVVIPDIAHSFFAEITYGVEDILDKSGYDLLLCHSRGDAAREMAEIRMLVGSRVDGLIVASTQTAKQAATFLDLDARSIPFVLVDRCFPGYAFPTVRVDDRKVGRMATEYLIGLGHRRVGHLRGPGLSPVGLRQRGYRDAMRAARLEAAAELTAEGSFDIAGGRSAMEKLLALRQRPSAVFAANDPMAIGAAYACRDAGLRVPEDISIVGAGNIEGAHHPNPFLTTIDWPREELGREAAAMLLDAIRKHKRGGEKVFAPRLLVRQSTGVPRRTRRATS